MERITKKELSVRLDVSTAYVAQLVKAGRVTVGEDGKVAWPDAREEIKKGENPAFAGHKKINKQAKSVPAKNLSNESAVELNKKFNKARTDEKIFAAKLKELEFNKEKGKLIPLADIIADAARTGEELRALLCSIPSRIAPALDGKPAVEIEAAITEAINEALTVLHETKFK